MLAVFAHMCTCTQAHCRRDGEWRNNWNEAMAEPVYRAVATYWEVRYAAVQSFGLADPRALCTSFVCTMTLLSTHPALAHTARLPGHP